MDPATWLDDLIGTDSRRTASQRAGKAESTLSRQLSRTILRPEMIIALCRAYGRPPVQGLAENGYLEPAEINAPELSVEQALRLARNGQLLDELQQRMERDGQRPQQPHDGDTVAE